VQVVAPAKINLSLKILGQRSDGFHEIETLVSPIALCDEIEIGKNDSIKGIRFQSDDPSVPAGDGNLIVRAAKSFFAATRLKPAVSIELRKRIPHGAGLGGGSSDAASALLALNELFEAKLPLEALAEIAETIGSDVPFFIFQSAALCKGRGELVTPVKLHRRFSVLLLKPAFAVSTAWAYSRWRDSLEIPNISYAAQEFAGQTFLNDLERPVFEKFIFLAQLKTWLLEQAEVGAALMSGSGSTVFAVMRKNADADVLAKRAKAELDPELWTCRCQTIRSAFVSRAGEHPSDRELSLTTVNCRRRRKPEKRLFRHDAETNRHDACTTQRRELRGITRQRFCAISPWCTRDSVLQ
jgi:4-diphosphocytidyl-2-C-methyl-D-erythritol kinase